MCKNINEINKTERIQIEYRVLTIVYSADF